MSCDPHFHWRIRNPWSRRAYTTAWRMRASEALAIAPSAELVGEPIFRNRVAQSDQALAVKQRALEALLLASMRMAALQEKDETGRHMPDAEREEVLSHARALLGRNRNRRRSRPCTLGQAESGHPRRRVEGRCEATFDSQTKRGCQPM